MKAAHISTKGEIIAIDGKTVRGSFDKKSKKSAIHMISAFAANNSVLHYLWRAVNQDGDEIDILVRKRKNKKAAM